MIQDIPFEIPPGQPPLVIVQAKAGDKPLALLLDTGNASPFDVLLTPEALARLRGEAPPASDTGAPPAVMAIQSAKVERFRLGPVKLRSASAGVSPAFGTVGTMLGRRVDGIVGHRLLDGRIVSIDYRTRRVDLSARTPRAQAIPFTVSSPSPLTLVDATINGKGPYRFAVDTGSTSSLVTPAVAKAAELGPGERVMHAGAGQTGTARLVRTTLTLGPVTRANRNVAITSAPQAIGAAAGVKLDGVLGADFFAGTRVTFDFKQNRLWVEQPRSDEAAPAGVERESN